MRTKSCLTKRRGWFCRWWLFSCVVGGSACFEHSTTQVDAAKNNPGQPPSSHKLDPVEMKNVPKFFRDGPGQLYPYAYAGPQNLPSEQWNVDLGAVISASPRLLKLEGQATIAFVGAHTGRFVGVYVNGPKAGRIYSEVELGGIIWSTAATAEVHDQQRLYVGADNDTLFAIDAKTMQILWRLRVGACSSPRARGPEGIRCDVDGGPTVGPHGDLYIGADGVYRISNQGQLRWHYPDSQPESSPPHVFSTPLVDAQQNVFVGTQGGAILALDETGKLLWKTQIGSADVDASPILDVQGNLYIGADDGIVYALDSKSGNIRWRYSSQGGIRSALTLGLDQTIYVSSLAGSLHALQPSGQAKWVFASFGPMLSSPVVDSQGRVFVGSQDDHLYALTREGTLLWSLDLPGDIDSSMAIAEDGTLVVGCDDGLLRAFR